jgi:hypothetical protein
MIALLTDPWFEAEFTTKTTKLGHWGTHDLQQADGLFLWCPCGYADPRYHVEGGGRPHGLIISFSNPRGVPMAPADAGSRSRTGGPSRWTIVSGTGYSDLTLDPSVDAGPEGKSCWHGFIVKGEVRNIKEK